MRCLAVACSNGKEEGWVLMGLMCFLDPPRPDSKLTIASAKELGITTKMITGDHVAIAVEMCAPEGTGGGLNSPRVRGNSHCDGEDLPRLGVAGGRSVSSRSGGRLQLPSTVTPCTRIFSTQTP